MDNKFAYCRLINYGTNAEYFNAKYGTDNFATFYYDEEGKLGFDIGGEKIAFDLNLAMQGVATGFNGNINGTDYSFSGTVGAGHITWQLNYSVDNVSSYVKVKLDTLELGASVAAPVVAYRGIKKVAKLVKWLGRVIFA